MKTIIAIVVAIAVYIALGAVVPGSARVALVVLPGLIGAFGALTFKGVVALASAGALMRGHRGR